jgi:hypothetical protein
MATKHRIELTLEELVLVREVLKMHLEMLGEWIVDQSTTTEDRDSYQQDYALTESALRAL